MTKDEILSKIETQLGYAQIPGYPNKSKLSERLKCIIDVIKILQTHKYYTTCWPRNINSDDIKIKFDK